MRISIMLATVRANSFSIEELTTNYIVPSSTFLSIFFSLSLCLFGSLYPNQYTFSSSIQCIMSYSTSHHYYDEHSLSNASAIQESGAVEPQLERDEQHETNFLKDGEQDRNEQTNFTAPEWKKLQSIHQDMDTVRLLMDSSESTVPSDQEPLDSASSAEEADEQVPLVTRRTRSRSTSRHLSASAAVAALAGIMVRSELVQQNTSEGTIIGGEASPHSTVYMTIDPEAPDVAYTLTRSDGSGYCRLGGNHSWKTEYPARCWAVGIGCFPCGLICCLHNRYKRCKRCGIIIMT
ncbi:hypothetical protein BDF22DRAFT_7489 [Syncephalis plumigaleata]|nr:hypothetical protein BDF22DRAFT_7489 [Syncephalis plumigaleata]